MSDRTYFFLGILVFAAVILSVGACGPAWDAAHAAGAPGPCCARCGAAPGAAR